MKHSVASSSLFKLLRAWAFANHVVSVVQSDCPVQQRYGLCVILLPYGDDSEVVPPLDKVRFHLQHKECDGTSYGKREFEELRQ